MRIDSGRVPNDALKYVIGARVEGLMAMIHTHTARIKCPSGTIYDIKHDQDYPKLIKLCTEALGRYLRLTQGVEDCALAVVEIPANVTEWADLKAKTGLYIDPKDGKLVIPAPPKLAPSTEAVN